jgi:hypothetical protein
MLRDSRALMFLIGAAMFLVLSLMWHMKNELSGAKREL